MKQKKIFSSGFTLIELMVVIAIIGILSAILVPTINTARDSAANSAIQSNLSNARGQAEIYFDRENKFSYDGVCDLGQTSTTSGIKVFWDSAAEVRNGLDNDCNDGDDFWIVAVQKVASEKGYICADSRGNVVEGEGSTVNQPVTGTGTNDLDISNASTKSCI